MDKKVVYCHFSFRRPKGESYGIFAAALYYDFEGKTLIAQKTRAFELWENHQHVTAIQAYEHALYCLWEWQYKLKEYNVTNVLLVTDNSILAGWIVNPEKNKEYTAHMRKATLPYGAGSGREILIPIGLCEPRDAEKSHKFCRLDLVKNKIPDGNKKKTTAYRLDIDTRGFKSALDIAKEDQPSGLEDLTELA